MTLGNTRQAAQAPFPMETTYTWGEAVKGTTRDGKRYPRAYSSAERASNSNATTGSSPATQASWPGSITYASPARSSSSVPSSWDTAIVPDWMTPTCRAWQLSVPTTGFTHSDHLQPGSNAKRAAVVLPI